MSKFTKLALGTVFLCVVSGTAYSAPELVLNGDFSASSTNIVPTNWTSFGPGAAGARFVRATTGSPSPFTPIDGNFALFRGQGSTPTDANATGIYQNLTIPGGDVSTATYTVSFKLIGPNNTPNYFIASVADAAGAGTGIGTSNLIKFIDYSNQAVQGTLTWITHSFTFTPQSTSVRLAFQGATANGSGWALDSVSVSKLDAAVPEIDAASGAGALALLVGVLGLVGERRRRA